MIMIVSSKKLVIKWTNQQTNNGQTNGRTNKRMNE